MRLLLTALLVLLAAPHGSAQAPRRAEADSARVTLDAALDAMQTKAYYASRVDWPAVRASAHIRTSSARRPAATYPAIREALAALGDGHSFLLTAEPEPTAPPRPVPAVATPPAPLGRGIVARSFGGSDGRVGYLRVPSFMGGGDDAVRFADSLLAAVRQIDAERPVGWIVDVRRNGGGNVWPMLAGLAPLLGDGVVGGSISTGGTRDWMGLDGSAATYITADTTLEVIRTSDVYALAGPLPPVAVLTDGATASSAEAVVLAFVGRPRSRRFGTATYGASSSNEGTELPDGSVLVITTGLMTDRTGLAYGVQIEPDVAVTDDRATGDDEVIGAATAWLLGHP